VFHGLDIVILVRFLAAVAYYIYRHVQKDRAAKNQAAAQQQPPLGAPRARR
jgi:hypothetical protein